MTATPDPLSLHAALQPDKARGRGSAGRCRAGVDVRRGRPVGLAVCVDARLEGVAPGRTGRVVRSEFRDVIAAQRRLPEGRGHRGPAQLPADGRGGRVRPRQLRRAPSVLVDAESAGLVVDRRAGAAPRVEHVLSAIAARRPGARTATPLVAAAVRGRAGRAITDEAGVMIYTSGTTGRPKGAVRPSTGDPVQVGALIQLIGYQPDDVYVTTGPLYHSGPGGSRPSRMALGNTVIVQRKFDAEDWLRLVERMAGVDDVLGPDADPHGVRARPRRQGPLRPLEHAAHGGQRRAVVDGPEAAVSRRLPDRLAVGGVRLDGDGCRHRARPGRPPPQARVVRAGGAPASRSSCSMTTATRSPSRVRRASCTCGRRRCSPTYHKAARQVRGGPPRRLPHRWRRRLPGRGGLLLHLRPQEGHDHQRRHEHLSGRDRGRAGGASRHLRGRGVRHPVGGVGRGGARRGRAAARLHPRAPRT